MRKSKLFKILTGILLLSMILAACSSNSSGTSNSGSKNNSSASGNNSGSKQMEVVFIPKLTGNSFFESGNDGAQEMAKAEGFKVTYDGTPEVAVSNQVNIINNAITRGVDAIAISSVSVDGLNQVLQKARDAGIKIVTWDSDVDPRYRSIYVNQGTPDILGEMLVEMAVSALDDPKRPIKFAWFYSSPTVPDQNAWVNAANEYIKEKYPSWELVTTEFGESDAQLSLQIGESILDTYPDIDVIICPDSTALPAMAQAMKNKGKNKNDVVVTGFATPNSMRDFLKDDTIPNHGLWDVKVQGALAVYIAKYLAEGNELKVGDKVNVPGIGEVEVQPNSIQGYDYEAEDSGIIVLPERVVFTKENTDNYNF